jgi:hypothetical protein
VKTLKYITFRVARRHCQAREADGPTATRLRVMIGRELDDRKITDRAATGAALGTLAPETTKLLTRHQWRHGDVELLEAATAQLGVRVQGTP